MERKNGIAAGLASFAIVVALAIYEVQGWTMPGPMAVTLVALSGITALIAIAFLLHGGWVVVTPIRTKLSRGASRGDGKAVRLYAFLRPFDTRGVGVGDGDVDSLALTFDIISCTVRDIPVRNISAVFQKVGSEVIQQHMQILSQPPAIRALGITGIQVRVNFTDSQLRRIQWVSSVGIVGHSVEVELAIQRLDSDEPIRFMQLEPGKIRAFP